jgi:DNA-binding beta-propeller fold protein YncE
MRHGLGMALAVALLGLLLLAPAAQASRELMEEKAVRTEEAPGGVLESPCGIALSPNGDIYVSVYYPRTVEVFAAGGKYQSSIGASAFPEGPCQLAITTGGALYANRWHEGVSRLLPSSLLFDEAESTGVAVDASGNVYVDDRTDIAIYEPSGALLRSIATDPGADYYGLAVSGEKVYAADAATETVKVFEADGAPAGPVAEINGSSTPEGKFVSLIDAALAVDPTNGHLLVMDNLQPGFVHPLGAIYEFDAAGSYLGKLEGSPIDGGPSGMAINSFGALFVTSGNSEEGAVFLYSAYSASGLLGTPLSGGGSGSIASTAAQGEDPSAPSSRSSTASKAPAASASETIQHGRFKVGVDASLAPKKLPRKGTAPVRFSLAAKITATKGSLPPQLRTIGIEINRHGRIEPKGLPVCQVDQIQPATNEAALEACGPSLVGTGNFSAKVLISQQAPFPSDGEVYAFNGTWKGHPAILAHVYGTRPVPTSATIPFVIGRATGTFGTKLTASLPQVTSKWGYVTGISMKLGKTFSLHGKRRSFLSAGCPAPKGFPGATFSLSRTSFAFEGGKKLSQVLSRSCKAG